MCDQLANIITFILLYLLELKDKLIAKLTKDDYTSSISTFKVPKPEDFDKNKPSKQL